MSSATTSTNHPQDPDTNHSFMSKHKKKLIISVVSAITIAALYFAYTNGYINPELISKSKEFLSSFGEKLLEITKYSVNFFKENLIISSIVTVIAVLITYFTYQAYKKRSEENEKKQKIDSIIINLNAAFNNLNAKLGNDKNEIDQTDLIGNDNNITELGGALINLIKKYNEITPEMLSNEGLNSALNKFQTSVNEISYTGTNNATVKITINTNDFKIHKDKENNLHYFPQIIEKLKPIKNILVPSNEVNLNSAEKQEQNNTPIKIS